MAHKKAGGSSRNGRDSEAKRLGVKKFGGESVLAGNIIVRQRGTRWYPGTTSAWARTIRFLHFPTVACVSAMASLVANTSTSKPLCRKPRNKRDRSIKGRSRRGQPRETQKGFKREKREAPSSPFFVFHEGDQIFSRN